MKRITVSTFQTRTEAEVAKGFLKSNGIDAFVLADDLGGAYQFPFQPNITGVKLQVKKHNLEEAHALLTSKE